ncbi:MAG: Gfo/Idh/MocA family oxidoreductase [Bryobacterales bacterium]|nr:Gfo/Idh/MocA family oxidoreductase [Bryobacteraceae bacterium]MDW8353628.1 Gfo/Idh/MocA family oxidoreductase [Bryobacterales bacterium]
MAVTRREWMTGIALGATAMRAPASDRKVRIGVVGGRFGATFQWHLDPDCEVVAVCDIHPQWLRRLQDVYRCPNAYRNFREMLKHPGMNAVAIFTPAPLHAWMTLESLKAGKHVMCAVPAGLSVEELERILEAVKRTGLKYMMAETSYYRPEIMTCMEWAREGRFGTIFYSEAEYHHEGLIALMFDERGLPTWRHGFPPMLYPTHCTGMIVPVTGERLVEVQAIGWGDGHEVLATNAYQNPFWNTTGFFKTSGGHSCRISVFWHVAAGGTERAQFFGDRLSFIMERPEGTPNTVVRIAKEGKTVLDANGYPVGEVTIEKFDPPDHFEKLPPSMRVKTGHGNSHTFLTHEFVRSIVEDRHPSVNIWEAIAYTLPGIVAHQSALRGGEPMKIRDYGRAPS